MNKRRAFTRFCIHTPSVAVHATHSHQHTQSKWRIANLSIFSLSVHLFVRWFKTVITGIISNAIFGTSVSNYFASFLSINYPHRMATAVSQLLKTANIISWTGRIDILKRQYLISLCFCYCFCYASHSSAT